MDISGDKMIMNLNSTEHQLSNKFNLQLCPEKSSNFIALKVVKLSFGDLKSQN